MKLTDLQPEFLGNGGTGVNDQDGKPVPRREGTALNFLCPCGCRDEITVHFENPLDGGPPTTKGPTWKRSGDTFDGLTLRPSIRVVQSANGCGWHGFITSGMVTNA